MKKSAGRNTKFVPINTSDITQEKVLFPGRRACLCEASKHGLVSNCLHCGRIVCEQEGSGPCFTCGHLVCNRKEQEIIQRQSKQSFKLYNKLMSQDSNKSLSQDSDKLLSQDSSNEGNTVIVEDPKLKKALQHRDKLLEYDRAVEKRTKVIDDENDYFQVDSQWLSAKEREILNRKKEEIQDLMHNRRKQTFTFDFAGRKIIDEKPKINYDAEELLKPDTSIFECQDANTLDIALDIQPVFIEDRKPMYTVPRSDENKRLQIRIQDKELQEMSDGGMCLSMHQPYASLLTAGIKKHEGRTWYTSYRGRLWIHAAGKQPLKEEIIEMENFYRSIRDDKCEYPKSYPAGCLLGCVDVVDCLPQEEYKSQYPEGENASPYVFICENPQELVVKFPMKGKHKIFKLESNVHQAAKKMLSRQTH